MSPIKNFAASILAATRISDGQSHSSPQPAHREPSIGLPLGLVDSAADEGASAVLQNGDRLAYMADVVELQRAELTRLMQENRRLHERVDQMAKLQEREQILRQEMHATLQRLSAIRPALTLPHPAGAFEDSAEAERKYMALKQSVARLVTYIKRLHPEPGPR